MYVYIYIIIHIYIYVYCKKNEQDMLRKKVYDDWQQCRIVHKVVYLAAAYVHLVRQPNNQQFYCVNPMLIAKDMVDLYPLREKKAISRER